MADPPKSAVGQVLTQVNVLLQQPFTIIMITVFLLR
jgi:hypothetical protein